jgi:aminobenzoyl-glutamate transport protein
MKKKIFGFLNLIRRGGNAFHHPAIIYFFLAVFTVFFSYIGHRLKWEAIHPSNGEGILILNLFDKEVLHQTITNLLRNFFNFEPLYIAIIALLAMSIAEISGFFKDVIKPIKSEIHKGLLALLIIVIAIISSQAGVLGFIVVVPLGGFVFQHAGRHPLAGMVAAYAAASCGIFIKPFSGSVDNILFFISEMAVNDLKPGFIVGISVNWYLRIILIPLVIIVCFWLTNKIIEPFLIQYSYINQPFPIDSISYEKRKVSHNLQIFIIVISILFACALVVFNIFNERQRLMAYSSVINPNWALIFLLLIFICLCLIYSFVSGRSRNILKGIVESFKYIGFFLLIWFFAKLFIDIFQRSNLGIVIAINGAEYFKDMGIGIVPMLILFIAFVGFINIFMISATGKWVFLAPMFIPIFIQMGFSPWLAQAAFRIGDIVTNMISPIMFYFILTMVYFRRYEPKCRVGTLFSTTLPYSLILFIAFTFLIIIWTILNLPLGPGVGVLL